MAGPSVAVRILGDLTGWNKSVGGTGDAATTATSRIKGAFSSVLGTLNKSGVLGPFGASIDAISSSMDSLSEKGASVGEKFLGVGGAAVGLGLGLQELGSKQQAAQQQLSAAISATGGSYAAYSEQIKETIGDEEHHGETATETMTAMQKLTQIMHNPTEAIKEMGLAADVAAAKHEDLTTAAGQVGKAFEGNTKILKDFGITTKVSGTDALQQLADVTQGQASAAADTFAGKVDGIKAHLEDVVSTFAQQYGPAITAAGAAMTGLGAVMEVGGGIIDAVKDSTILETAAETAKTAATGIATAAQWAFNAAMDANPITLVVVALAALVAAFVLAYNKVTWFRDGVNDLWTFIKSAFDGIEKAASDVFDWLAKNWPLVLGILTGPFGLMLEQVITHWNDVSTFLSGIPGKIATIFADAGTWLEKAGENIIKGLVDGITGAAKTAVDAVKKVITDVKNVPGDILHMLSPSKVFEEMGRNTIQGYVNGITATAGNAVSAVGGAMSAVAGTSSPSSGGPLVNMQNVTISSAVDLDLVTQKITGALLAGRV